MKKLFIALILSAFMTPGLLVLAAEPGLAVPGEPHINCCFQDGQCLRTRRENCALKKGIVVEDCKQCPGVWGKKSKKTK
jgi:hypothetical protein